MPNRDAPKAGQNSHKGEQRNEGEGNRTAARRYNQATEKFAKSGRVDEAKKKAEEAMRGPEHDELTRAEDIGRSRQRH
jgi:hypothetical protein